MRCTTGGAVRREAVEEVQRGDVHAERRATEVALLDEVIEKCPHGRLAQRRRRLVMIRREPLRAAEVHPLRHGAHAPEPQIDCPDLGERP